MRKIISREQPNRMPVLPLPIHVRSVGYNEADCGWREDVPGRVKNFVQLFWTVRGTGEFTRNGETVRTGAGDVFYRLPGEDHRQRSLGPGQWRYYWMTFDGAGARDFMLAYAYPRTAFHAGSCPASLFLEIEHLVKLDTPYAARHAVAAAAEILALAGGREELSGELETISRFLELAERRISDPKQTVSTLAAELGVHRSTLTRLFKKAMSVPPGDYLRDLKMRRALSLLRETGRTVKETAYAAGFSDSSYFCRTVKAETGKTPGGVRKSAEAGHEKLNRK